MMYWIAWTSDTLVNNNGNVIGRPHLIPQTEEASEITKPVSSKYRKEVGYNPRINIQEAAISIPTKYRELPFIPAAYNVYMLVPYEYTVEQFNECIKDYCDRIYNNSKF